MSGAVVLFTRDLRMSDHPALWEATNGDQMVVPMFVVDRSLLVRSPNRAHFLFESLADLDDSLRARGSALVIRDVGDPLDPASLAAAVTEVARDAGCDAVHVTEDVSAYARRREEALRDTGITVRCFPGHAVVEPGDVVPAGGEGTHYKVFTPYHRAWAHAPRRPLLAPPTSLPQLPGGLDFGPRPDPTSIAADASQGMPGGESAGRARLDAYLMDDVDRYEQVRNDPAADATSKLSPYLRFGCISPNELVHRLADSGAGPRAPELIRQVAWRDFFLQLLAADPSLAWRDLRPHAQPEPSPSPRDPLAAWREGRTGLPLVDAGMRQLLREGWMHNRVRMVVGSFLTRRLGIAWQEGFAHFDRYLLDGDVGNNAGNWQWVAGTGSDPRRARVLNPVRQARRFDPSGDYVRRYVEELTEIEAPDVFAPWRVPGLLEATGYPPPVVEVNASS
jgi:deoxyribodipyrimidine photo-lyase